MKRYDPKLIEPKWQSVWEETGLWRASDDPHDKAYVIPMFPYPSGDGLHVGHPRPYTAADVYSHFQRYHGKDVLHATGWDAFGLPAENAAIKKGVPPAANTAANIDNFRRQLKSLGLSYDWSREVDTSDPAYYRWTQWIFLQLFKAGLAYRGEGWQWWCPKDKTVLANEQVVDGACERCGTTVTKKQLTQWYFKVTDYAGELLDNLEDLDWPESIKALQRNWIGRSEGAEVTFATEAGELVVYTTRPDTLFGATYMVLAPEHDLVEKLTTANQKTVVENYVAQTKRESDIARTATDKEKTGVFTGSYATNPVNGEQIPIWIADYVLATYGTGAIMAVPAHDQRDYDFATKFGLPVKEVVQPEFGEPHHGAERRQSIVAVVEDPRTGAILTIDWGNLGGRLLVGGGIEEGESAEVAARREIAEETGYTNLEFVSITGPIRRHYHAASKDVYRDIDATGVYFRLQDDTKQPPSLEADETGKFSVEWVSQEQAYQEVTSPLHAHVLHRLHEQKVFTGEGTMVDSGAYDGLSSPDARQRIVADLQTKGRGEPKTGFKLRDWLISRQRYWGAPIPIVHCLKCGPVAVPEDQLPVELPIIDDYLPVGNGRSPLAKVPEFVQTTCPNCDGPAERETDTMDTFADSSWYFLRYPSPHDDTRAFDPEAVKKWLPVDTYVGGADHAVLHLIYARFWTMALADLGHLDFREPFLSLRNHGMIQAADGHKMSKSKGNVVNPDELIEAFGADTFRVYEMFIGPYDQAASWDDRGIEGAFRFLKRVWALGQGVAAETAESSRITDTANAKAVAAAIRHVTRSIEQFHFNTAISALMEALNALTSGRAALASADGRRVFGHYLILLSPFAPHLTEELWHELGHEESIFANRWPEYDPSLLAEDVVTIVVQVNGKVRGNLTLPADGLSEEVAAKAALVDSHVQKFLAGKEVRKQIYVPGKLLNLVV